MKKKKIKVMHLLSTGVYSGAEKVAVSIIKGTGELCESIYVSPNGYINYILRKENIPHYSIKKLNPIEVKRAINKIRPDIIHAHDFKDGVVAVCTFTKIPIINHIHNNNPWIKKIGVRTILFGLCSIRYKKIVTVSDSIMREYVFGKHLQAKTIVVGNPIDTNSILEKAQQDIRKEYYDVVFLGRLSDPKNPLKFVNIIYDLSKKITGIRACIIGDGEQKKDVEQRIIELGMSDVIQMQGFQENPYGILWASKVLCMPSKWEGFGLAAIEAMTLGKPVVASFVGGLKDIVNSSCGKLCTERQEFVQEIEKLVVDKNYYKIKSQNAINRAAKMNNQKQYEEKLCQIYKEVLTK